MLYKKYGVLMPEELFEKKAGFISWCG